MPVRQELYSSAHLPANWLECETMRLCGCCSMDKQKDARLFYRSEQRKSRLQAYREQAKRSAFGRTKVLRQRLHSTNPCGANLICPQVHNPPI